MMPMVDIEIDGPDALQERARCPAVGTMASTPLSAVISSGFAPCTEIHLAQGEASLLGGPNTTTYQGKDRKAWLFQPCIRQLQ